MKIPNEDELMLELERLEKSTQIRKGGDALQAAPHDGGLATEGTNIQSKAIKKAIKAMVKGGMSKADAEATAKKAFTSTDSDSESDAAVKGFGADGDSDADSDDGDNESDDDSSSEDDEEPPPMAKSVGAAALSNASGRNNSLRKALVDESPDVSGQLDAAPILGQLIDAIDRLARQSTGPSKKDIGSLRKSIAGVQEVQSSFNSKLAKALSMIATRVIDTETLVKKMANEPITQNRQPTLRKSDLHQPSFHGNEPEQIDGRPAMSPLHNIEYLKIQEALVDICMKGGADITDITKFENSKGNLNMLPQNVLKQLEQRLCAETA